MRRADEAACAARTGACNTYLVQPPVGKLGEDMVTFACDRSLGALIFGWAVASRLEGRTVLERNGGELAGKLHSLELKTNDGMFQVRAKMKNNTKKEGQE